MTAWVSGLTDRDQKSHRTQFYPTHFVGINRDPCWPKLTRGVLHETGVASSERQFINWSMCVSRGGTESYKRRKPYPCKCQTHQPDCTSYLPAVMILRIPGMLSDLDLLAKCVLIGLSKRLIGPIVALCLPCGGKFQHLQPLNTGYCSQQDADFQSSRC